MRRQMLKSKIHRATVTEADLNYVGSITVDLDLMEKADFIENEKVVVLNINNGARFETYVIHGPRGSKQFCLNGAAARLVQVGDRIIVMSFASYDESELANHDPIILQMDEHNNIVEI